ncbi:MAG: UDP-N-acetylglucosamine 1-carboxyvinyltransferase [Candidatus Omnitrophica bacterium]|nr:UDP-N-acetylglucosamine 1-carboxyvinyltransferase [Candidatus Omnitrophota bacterium]MDD5351899.1 UDP-N-acetylglucosamine 1-carboxyvinyltransferase [Candidatus Omnitrophota bacterium]MDD5550725.1 UDP-N-acetylglucosamine 1-carboxyvinyltransferase [Candidatus Omnitrophota bacterium]
MDKLVIEGGRPLKGSVQVSGSKNSLLPILAATLLTPEKCVIKNAPLLSDTYTMLKIIRNLGVAVEMDGNVLQIKSGNFKKYVAPYRLVSTMRASFCVLGPILARLKKAEVSLPGGCVIGVRPVDLHIKGLKALGTDIEIKEGNVCAKTRALRGKQIFLGGAFGSSVLATANVMMAAVLAKGTTVIENAACEPETVDLANFLNKMGAKIKGHGSPRIEIKGVKSLSGVEYEVIADRIEAGTFAIAAAITKGEVTIKNINVEYLSALIEKLEDAGVTIKRGRDFLFVKRTGPLKPVDITTLPYPGFPTDMQAQFMSLMGIASGISVIAEKIYPDRFMHIPELNRMGAQIFRQGPYAIVHGVKSLNGAPVMASDLRASAALVLAGLIAKDKTEIFRIYHLDRGYENLDKKLVQLGAKISREKQ